MNPLTDFAGKTVVVTGAAGGLGRSFAEGFARVGGRLVVADIDNEGAQATATAIGNLGGESLGLQVDVTNKDSTDALAKAAMDHFGRIDVLVNNAAIYAKLNRTAFTSIDPDEWDRVMAVNVKGSWLCSSSIYPHLTRPGGRIINIASATVYSGSPLWMHYVASKSAVIGMSRVMAREVGESGVTVNVIAPGFTLTDASYSLIENAETYGVNRGAIKRSSQPEDIVGTAIFLASESASYITGQTLVVDGGKQFI